MLVTVSFSLDRLVLATLSGLRRGKTKIVEILSGLPTEFCIVRKGIKKRLNHDTYCNNGMPLLIQ